MAAESYAVAPGWLEVGDPRISKFDSPLWFVMQKTLTHTFLRLSMGRFVITFICEESRITTVAVNGGIVEIK